MSDLSKKRPIEGSNLDEEDAEIPKKKRKTQPKLVQDGNFSQHVKSVKNVIYFRPHQIISDEDEEENGESPSNVTPVIKREHSDSHRSAVPEKKNIITRKKKGRKKRQ